MKPHKHRDIIVAWADGHEIEYKDIDGWKPVVSGSPAWFEDREYRIKPEYPKSKMSNQDLLIAVSWGLPGNEKRPVEETFRLIADAAIARAIVDGQVIPVAELKIKSYAPLNSIACPA